MNTGRKREKRMESESVASSAFCRSDLARSSVNIEVFGPRAWNVSVRRSWLITFLYFALQSVSILTHLIAGGAFSTHQAACLSPYFRRPSHIGAASP